MLGPASDARAVDAAFVAELAGCSSVEQAARATLRRLVAGDRQRSGRLLRCGQVVDTVGVDGRWPVPPTDRTHRQWLHQDWRIELDAPALTAEHAAVLGAGSAALLLLEQRERLRARHVRDETEHQQLETLLELQALTARRAPRQLVLDTLVRGAAHLLGCTTAFLHERDPDDRELLRLVSAVGIDSALGERLDTLPLATGFIGSVLREDSVGARQDTTSGRGQEPEPEERPDCAAQLPAGLVGLVGAPVRQGGRPIGVLSVATDDRALRFVSEDESVLASFATQAAMVTENARVLAERDAALHDALTGLPGRRLFVDRLEHALRQRERDDRELGLLFVDLDDFKPINDSLGHQAGDEALEEVARRLRAAVRAGDTAARMGGDEFAVLLVDADGDVPEMVAQRILDQLLQPVVVLGREVGVGVSIGVAKASQVIGDVEDLLRAADLAMYTAKDVEGSAVVSFDASLQTRAVEKLFLEVDVRRALATGQLRTVLQPIVAVASGATVGFEALLRWRHPTRGEVPATELVQLAEQTGEIHEIGDWVIEQACEQLAAWDLARGNGPLPWVSVNVSPLQLDGDHLATHVEAVLQRLAVAPDRLVLEVTESALIADPVATRAALDRLRATRVRVAIDDFGTGHSALAYLQWLPVDVLKLDRGFLPDEPDDERSWALVELVVGLARTLGLLSLAEGVETPEQLERLRSLGCDLVQGYHFAMPLEQQEATQWADGHTVAS